MEARSERERGDGKRGAGGGDDAGDRGADAGGDGRRVEKVIVLMPVITVEGDTADTTVAEARLQRFA